MGNERGARQEAGTRRRETGWWVLVLSSLLWWGVPLCAAGENAAEGRTWRYVSELSEDDLRFIDLRTDPPRDSRFPYIPAERYPFEPPYTAEEMGFLSTEFAHMPRWDCVFIEDYGSITSSGYLTTSKVIGLVLYHPSPGLLGQLTAKPGEWYTRFLFQATAPPEEYGRQSFYTLYRTDQQFTTKANLFAYLPELRRVRRQPQPRRQDKYPGYAQAFDDFLNRDAWEFSWRLVGMDVLYETVRFPKTRTSITLAASDGSFYEVSTQELKLMGRDYPHYTPEGGVECYVVEARAREEWIPGYYVPKIIYWLDRHTFFPLRIEQYDSTDTLVYVEDRTAQLLNPQLEKQGYAGHIFLSWDIPQDLMSYDVHDAYQPRHWSAKDREVFFSPDFMRRVWFVAPLKTQATIPRPEQFFLRPHLYQEKFLQERKVLLSPQLEERIRAQEAVGRLVFEENRSGS